jgi:hypothetical protein
LTAQLVGGQIWGEYPASERQYLTGAPNTPIGAGDTRPVKILTRSTSEGFVVADAVPADDFLTWAMGVGIGFDPRYPDSDGLVLLPPRESSRFWLVPDHPYSIPHLVEALLGGLDRWEAGYLSPRVGRWPTWADPGLPNERVRDVVWRTLGMPAGWAGAARISREERPFAVAALFASLALGGDSCSDLYFVPDHGRQIVWAGHHDAIHVACEDEARMLEFVRHMEGAGFALPTEPPDATFKWPAWMPQDPTAPDAATEGGRDLGLS